MMSKVRISNHVGTSINEYPGPVTVEVDGVKWGPVVAPQVDTSKLAISGDTNAAAGALLGGGSGGYAGGDCGECHGCGRAVGAMGDRRVR